MSTYARNALGLQGIHIVKQAADRLRELQADRVAAVAEIQERRNRLRERIDAASVRPTPGTSDLLGRPLRQTVSFGYTDGGRLGEVPTHDLVALAPIHLHVAADEEGFRWTVRKTIR